MVQRVYPANYKSDAMAIPTKNTEQLIGVIKILTYENKETGYFIAKVDVPGKGERTVDGTAPVIHVGERIVAKGSWGSSSYGPKFKATEVTLSAPTTGDGAVKFMTSALKGIGKGFAQKLVNEFGDNVFSIIENKPERLKEVKGVTQKKLDGLLESYALVKSTREVMVFLQGVGLSSSRAAKILTQYGKDAGKTIKANPYILCKDIHGIGFKTADEAAAKQGIPHDSEFRVSAGILHCLSEAEGQGSCGLPVEVLREKASSLLGLDYAQINRGFELELQSGQVFQADAGGVSCMFSRTVFNVETLLADYLLKHAAHRPAHTVVDVDVAILGSEVDLSINLEAAQRDAVRSALLSQVCVITGGPGTGKTTITRVIMECLEAEGLKPLMLCAPTGKAAKRAAEATGFEAVTIHRTLEVQRDGHFKFNEKNPLKADVLVIDESSMVDIFLFLSLIRALHPKTRLIIIGDDDQLPSVGPGKVLRDIITSGAFPTVMLRQVFRQAATSQIIRNAHLINNGDMPDMGYSADSDFHFMDMSPKNPKSIEDKDANRVRIEKEILRMTADMAKLGYDPVRDVQILAPMRKGLLGVLSLNLALQRQLNPNPSAVLEWYGTRWGVGDKVMQLKNNYDKCVFNGDVGYIEVVDTKLKAVFVRFDQLLVEYKCSELDELSLAYAITIHKSQGSEFPVVIMPLDSSHYMMLRRNLVYTGITRAKKLCVVIGQPHAMKTAVEKPQNDERWTRLKDLLMKGLPREMRGHMLEEPVLA